MAARFIAGHDQASVRVPGIAAAAIATFEPVKIQTPSQVSGSRTAWYYLKRTSDC